MYQTVLFTNSILLLKCVYRTPDVSNGEHQSGESISKAKVRTLQIFPNRMYRKVLGVLEGIGINRRYWNRRYQMYEGMCEGILGIKYIESIECIEGKSSKPQKEDLTPA